MKAEDDGHTTLDTARHTFVGHLRRALHHLYDPNELRKSPLLQLLELDPQTGVLALRHILEEAIESLKPPTTVSTQSDAWRTYRALYHRYVEQFSQADVATNLSLSVRQLRRHEGLALQMIADGLIKRYNIAIQTGDRDGGASGPPPMDAVSGDDEDSSEGIDTGPVNPSAGMAEELRLVERSFPSEQVDIIELARSALQAFKPVMEASRVTAVDDLPDGLLPANAQWVTIRQVLLNVLLAAIRSVPGGRIRLTGGYTAPQLWLDLRAEGQNTLPGGPGDIQRDESLAISRQLAAISGASLDYDFAAPSAAVTARLMLPAIQQMPVLVIDDNGDVLLLMQRYLSSSRYRYVGTRDPAHMMDLVQQTRPCAIILDVMLPSIDGWELLGRLRENPRTRDIPVIICTILPQEDLALTLGASAFLRKPVNRERLLQVLDQQIAGAPHLQTATEP